MKLFRFPHPKHAFSLVELMITVAIMSLLTLIATEKFVGAKIKAQQAETRNLFDEITKNLQTFMQVDDPNYAGPGGFLNINNSPQAILVRNGDGTCTAERQLTEVDCKKTKYNYYYIACNKYNVTLIAIANETATCLAGSDGWTRGVLWDNVLAPVHSKKTNITNCLLGIVPPAVNPQDLFNCEAPPILPP